MLILDSCKNAHILAILLEKQAAQKYCYIMNCSKKELSTHKKNDNCQLCSFCLSMVKSISFQRNKFKH